VTKNNELGGEFESEITRHNDDQKEAGQIIQAINNIYSICEKLADVKGRKLQNIKSVTEDRDPELINGLIKKLATGQEYIGDLMAVSEKLKEHGDDRIGDKDKYYADIAKIEGAKKFAKE